MGTFLNLSNITTCVTILRTALKIILNVLTALDENSLKMFSIN